MARGETTAPDGSRWQVRRRWLNEPVRKFRWRPGRPGRPDDSGWLDALNFSEGSDDLLAGVAIAVAAAVALALFVFVLLPLFGLLLELALVVALVSSGLLGRVFLRRPWIVEAAQVGEPGRVERFAVTGWRRSGRMRGELEAAIRATGVPAALAEGRRLDPVG